LPRSPLERDVLDQALFDGLVEGKRFFALLRAQGVDDGDTNIVERLRPSGSQVVTPTGGSRNAGCRDDIVNMDEARTPSANP
jgi:hypothetical protein